MAQAHNTDRWREAPGARRKPATMSWPYRAMISRHLIVLSLVASAAALVAVAPVPSLTVLAQSALGSGLAQPRPDMPVFARAEGDDQLRRDIAIVRPYATADGKLPPCAHNRDGGIRLQKMLFIYQGTGDNRLAL